MSNDKLLLEISNLLDIKLQATESRLKEEIQQMKTELQGEIQQVRYETKQVKTELQGEIQQVRYETKQVKTELQGEIQQVKTDLQSLKICVEDNIIPRLQNIEACYTSTYDRYRREIEKTSSMEMDISILKNLASKKDEREDKSKEKLG